jgi:hypothetical protein
MRPLFVPALSIRQPQARRSSEVLQSANPMPEIQRGSASAQSALIDILERQPLLIGAIALPSAPGCDRDCQPTSKSSGSVLSAMR